MPWSALKIAHHHNAMSPNVKDSPLFSTMTEAGKSEAHPKRTEAASKNASLLRIHPRL